MNTKGTRFLAALAILAMVFATFAVIAPTDAETGDDTPVVDGEPSSDDTTAEAIFEVNNVTYEKLEDALAALPTKEDKPAGTIKVLKSTGITLDDALVTFVLADSDVKLTLAEKFTGALKYGGAAVTISGLETTDGVTITPGSLEIDGDFSGDVTIEGKKEVYLKGTLTGGKLDIVGNVIIDDSLTIQAGAVVTVAQGAVVTLGQNGKIVAGDGATGVLVNNGTIQVSPGAEIPSDVTGTGVCTSAIGTVTIEDQNVNGTATKTTVYPLEQRLTVQGGNGTWTIGNGTDRTSITINGILEVPSSSRIIISTNAELILASGAVLNLDGTIQIQEGDDLVDSGRISTDFGTINVSNLATVSGEVVLGSVNSQMYGNLNIEDGAEFTLRNGGVLTVSSYGAVTVGTGSVLNLQGEFQAAKIKNSGIVTIDSKTPIAGDTTISQEADGATVDVKKVVFGHDAGKSITITDDGLKLYTFKYTDASGKKVSATVNVGDEVDGADYISVIDYTDNPSGDELKVSGTMPVNEIVISDDAVGEDLLDIFQSFKVVEKVSSTVLETEPASNTSYVYLNQRLYTNSMQIEGNTSARQSVVDEPVGTPVVGPADVDVALNGDSLIEVVSGAVLDVGYNVTMINSGNVTVAGELDSVKTAVSSGSSSTSSSVFTNTNVIKLTGLGIVKNSSKLGGTVYAAMIEKNVNDNTQYWYMTVDEAIDMINEDSTVDTATVVGDSTVTRTVTLNNEESLVLANGVTLTVGDEDSDVMTLAKGSTLRGTGAEGVNVIGTLYAEDCSDNKIASITVSDVFSQQLDSKGNPMKYGWAKWTNVTTALAEAPEGSMVTISKEDDYVYLIGNTEVRKGVTLYIPDDARGIVLNNGVTLTVNGTLRNDSEIFAQTEFDVGAKNLADEKSSAIIVNGVMETVNTSYAYNHNSNGVQTGYDNMLEVSLGAPIAGAYYTTDDYYVISSIAVAMADVEDINSAIVLNGTLSASDVFFEATEDCDQIIIGAGLFNAGVGGADDYNVPTVVTIDSLALGESKFMMAYDASLAENKSGIFSGSVYDLTGQMTFKHLETSGDGLTVQDSDGELTLKGNFVIDDTGDKMTVTSGYVYTASGMDVTGNAMDVASDAYLVANGNAANIDALTVNGTLSVPNAKVLTVDKTLQVNGSVEVSPATSSKTQGTLNIADKAYFGISKSSIVAASAVVSGPFTPGENAVLHVAAGTTFDSAAQAVLDDMKNSTEFYVSDKLWITVYTDGAAAIYDGDYHFKPTDIGNADFKSWQYKSSGTLTPIKSNKDVGDYAQVYAELDYEIYTVNIVTDSGIKAVSIDGIQMLRSPNTEVGTNTFVTLHPIEAGSHKVTYTLQDGYEGTAALYTEYGTILQNLSFTVSGTDDDDRELTLQLYGTEKEVPAPTPEPEKESEWTITTILLLVLVILIAIMAVIVAMRLMRS